MHVGGGENTISTNTIQRVRRLVSEGVEYTTRINTSILLD